MNPLFDADNEDSGMDRLSGYRKDLLQLSLDQACACYIGTNSLDPAPNDVKDILDESDRYERDYGKHIKVILAKIINRGTYSQMTTWYNFNIEKLAWDRILADHDDITVIDMEFDTDIDYGMSTRLRRGYVDNSAPEFRGSFKMAGLWFKTLQMILPAPSQKARIISIRYRQG
jgi:hypothetical protein